jgi:hypothetical protein
MDLNPALEYERDAQQGERTRSFLREASGVDITHHTCYYLVGIIIIGEVYARTNHNVSGREY